MRSERVITGHPVQLELIVAPIFADPDGDPLTITVDWAMRTSTPGAWNGLRIVGDRLEGIAAQPDVNAVSISAKDGRGGLAIYRIELTVAANQAPMVPAPAPDKLVGIGEAIRFDATQSGNLFVDPDGDALTYSVRFEPAPTRSAGHWHDRDGPAERDRRSTAHRHCVRRLRWSGIGYVHGCGAGTGTRAAATARQLLCL